MGKPASDATVIARLKEKVEKAKQIISAIRYNELDANFSETIKAEIKSFLES